MEDGDPPDFVFVEFNAWLYQGYDDARASLLDVIATALKRHADERETGVEKVQALIKRVNWLRAAKLTAGSGLALALGLPPTGLIGEAFRFGKAALAGDVTSDDLDAIVLPPVKRRARFPGSSNPARTSLPQSKSTRSARASRIPCRKWKSRWSFLLMTWIGVFRPRQFPRSKLSGSSSFLRTLHS